MAIGAAVGAIGSLFTGRRRKTLQQRKKTLAQDSLRSAQRMYNQGIESYNQRQSAQSLYDQQMQMSEDRMNNVYQALS
jgi:gas vesicle protein